jgi:arginine/lysine/ornithine decarboxylase
MASLDVARHYLATYEDNDMEYLLKEISRFKKELSTIQSIKVLDYPDSHGDTLKVTIQSRGTLSGFELQKIFEEIGIYTELADPYNVLLILPLLKENQDYPLVEASSKIKAVLADVPKHSIEEQYKIRSGTISELAIPYEKLSNVEKEAVQISEAVGNVCGETIIPYPPGIPLLLMGELITEEKINQLIQLIDMGARFQGGSFLDKKVINVVKTSS